jgi:chemotaxis methyl-accepting protein methylase
MALTFFFRDRHTLQLALDHVLPVMSGFARPRLWDAGCATGQEPYSLAILRAERMGHFGFRNVQIQATDIVCRNELLHLAPPRRAEVVRRFHRALQPGGYLVMEQTQDLPPGAETLFRKVVPDAQLFTRIH